MEKEFEGILIVNWKTGEMRVIKREKKLGPSEIPIRVNLTLELPEKPELAIKGKVTIPTYKCDEMVLEGI